jgi:predicted dehydrogenase
LYLLQAQYLYDAGPVTSWHADKAAGGGALMEQGSHMFDLVVWLIGLPESVYCLVGTGQRPAGQADQPLYDTDDSAVCLLRYGYKAAATVTVSRCFNPVNESLAAYGDGGSIQAETNRCLLRDRSGAVLDSFADEEPPVKVFQRQVEAFARAAAGEVNRYECSAWESLLTLAVADAAGLSSRTGQPESPADWLAKHGLSAADCLKYSPTPEVRP